MKLNTNRISTVTEIAAFKVGAIFLTLACAFTATNAQADGLSDFKAALARLQGQTPVKAVVEIKSANKAGEGKDLQESTTQCTVQVEENERGLQILFSKEMLARADAETRAKEKNPKEGLNK